MNITRFWDEHYRIEDEELRVQLAEVVVETLDRPQLEARKYRHPMTRRKDKFTYFSIIDILSDFVIKAEQADEHYREYPVKNAEAAHYDVSKRKLREGSFEKQTSEGEQFDLNNKHYRRKKKRDKSTYRKPQIEWGPLVTYSIKDTPLTEKFTQYKTCVQQWKKNVNIV